MSPQRVSIVSALVALLSVQAACDDSRLSSDPAAAVAGPQLSASPVRAMRFKGTVALVDPVDPPPAPCAAFLNSVIAGNATHMGRFEGVGSTCITSQVAPDPDPPFEAPGPPPYATATFTNPLWVLTAAHGDELWLESSDGVAVLSLADGSLRAVGTHEIIGGTGRFANATGELTTRGVNADGIGPDDVQSRGWISY
ncbi:MAG: hypothetical protein ABFS34_15970 [Gemmatimonadota bacterium]